jgi:mono/diheme cytochrome c family protein
LLERASPVRAFIGLLVLTTTAAFAADDRALYAHWCARCHGDAGDGRGPAAVALAFNGTPPRDFTRGRFKVKSTPANAAPTDEDLARTIREGIPGTAMPYFSDLLSDAEVAALVGVVRGFDAHPAAPSTPIDLGPPPEETPALQARGATLYQDLACWTCHGDAGHGDGSSAATLRNEDGTPAHPTDLTRPWTFRGGGDAGAIAMRLATGLAGTPMPSFRESVSTPDLWALAAHVRSLARAPSLHDAAVAAAHRPPGNGEKPEVRGAYLAKSGTCFLCHVQMRPDGAYAEGTFGAGGMRVEIAYLGTVYTRNLTPDATTGLGSWTAADLRTALHTGRTRDGRTLSALDMPWTILTGLTDADVDAIFAYLRTLTPVRNFVPPPAGASLGDALGRKVRALATGEQLRASYHPGNAGYAPAGGEDVPAPQNPIGPVVAFGAGFAGMVVGVLLRRARPVLGILVMVAAVAGAFVYTWPPLAFLPPALVRGERYGAGALGLPPLRPPPAPVAAGNRDEDALTARGRYVAIAGTCTLCHTAGPSVTRLWAPFPDMGGGMRVEWRVFGRTYSRNLTPDAETGLGRWSDAQIRRAITSGISRDGRLMHWQAMPWDHFSHLRPEDLEALVAYLRHLPPAWSRVPDPEPPRPGDEAGDTFFFGYTGEYRRAAAP